MIDRLSIEFPVEALEAIAVRAAELVAERAERSPWMDRKAAADYLGCSVSSLEKRRDVPHVKDNGRVLYHRERLDAWLLEREEATPYGAVTTSNGRAALVTPPARHQEDRPDAT